MNAPEAEDETEAMRAGAEVERGANETAADEHTSRTQPASKKPVLTTDPEAQQDESVIEPMST